MNLGYAIQEGVLPGYRLYYKRALSHDINRFVNLHWESSSSAHHTVEAKRLAMVEF